MPLLSQKEFDIICERVRRLENPLVRDSRPVIAQPNPPDGARLGQIWYDQTDKVTKIFDGREWVAVGGGGSSGGGQVHFTNQYHTTGGGNITITGCPFQPTCIEAYMSFSDASGFAFSYGAARSTTDQRYVATASNGNSENGSGTYFGTVRNSSGTAIKRLAFSSFTADGAAVNVPVSAGTASIMFRLSA